MQIKSFAIGFVLCILMTVSSLYCSMKLGLLAWPTLFVSLLCFYYHKLFSKRASIDMKQVTLSHTLATSGAMVAGAIAYTLPGVWIADKNSDISLISVAVASLVGVVIGVFCTLVYKEPLIDKEDLAFPVGSAAYLTLSELSSTDAKKNKKVKDKANKRALFIPMLISALVSFFQSIGQVIGKFPRFLMIPSAIPLYKGNDVKKLDSVVLWLSPMAIGMGALLGAKVVLVLFLASIFSYFAPSVLVNFTAPDFDFYNFKTYIALALILGSGVGVFLKSILKKERLKIVKKLKKANKSSKFTLFIASAIGLLIMPLTAKLSIVSSAILLITMLLATYLSARLTGESGINPMEVFSYISFMLISLVQHLAVSQIFLIMVTVCVATGLTGDIMNDFKSGVGFGVDVKKQGICELIGASISAIICVFIIFAMKNKGFDFSLPAQDGGYVLTQARAMAVFVKNGVNLLFVYFLIIGVVSTLFGVNSAIIGLGIYLPPFITIALAVGALLAKIAPKSTKDTLPISASGLLCGEAIVSAIISFFAIGG